MNYVVVLDYDSPKKVLDDHLFNYDMFTLEKHHIDYLKSITDSDGKIIPESIEEDPFIASEILELLMSASKQVEQ